MTEIFTIGYEGLTPRQFFGLIASAKISMLIDVRELPLSRKRGFSKTPLAGICKRRRIFYRHMPERSEEHTSELQSPCNLVCRLLLEKKTIACINYALPGCFRAYVSFITNRSARALPAVHTLPPQYSRPSVASSRVSKSLHAAITSSC